MKNYFKQIIILFITFAKIGLFTFGGGYAMIPFIQEEVVDKRKWLKQDEVFEILVIAESTPGPVSVNIATFVGYKVAGFFGAMFATIGLALPSFIIIFLISLIFDDFMKFEIVQKAFKGIKVGVMILLLSAILKLSKGMKKDLYFYVLFILSLLTSICFSVFIPSFSWISLILIALGLILGVLMTLKRDRDQKGGNK